VTRGALCGGLLLRPEDPERARWVRRLRLPNPAHLAWLKHGKGPEPPREVHPLHRQDGGPWNGGAIVPRYAPGAEGADRMTAPEAEPLSFEGELRPYQLEAVDAATGAGHGVVVAPTGAGKTVIGCAILARHATPALVLVHSRDLADQWVERIERFCGVRAELLGYGKRPSEGARVVVASLQTLARWSWWDLHQWGERFGVVIQDEAHHAPARTYLGVLAGLRGRYRYGLTATPEREDGLTPWMLWTLGSVVYQVDAARLEQAGAVLRPTIRTWRAPDVPVNGMESHERDRALADDELRNEGLALQCRILCERGHVVLVLVRLVEHARNLSELLCGAGLDAAAMVGAMRSKERAEVLERMRDGSVQVVVATSLADEGLDAPRLSAVVLAAPTKNIGRTLQRIGRVLRPCEGAPAPVVVDVVDSFGPFQGYARQRQTVYRARGWLDSASAAR
jgi:superfamily II DNA or RNA helicase